MRADEARQLERECLELGGIEVYWHRSDERDCVWLRLTDRRVPGAEYLVMGRRYWPKVRGRLVAARLIASLRA